MDDTLKYLLGGLGVLGLAILAIPSAETVQEKAVTPAAAIQPQLDPVAMPDAEPSYEEQPEENMADEADGEQDEFATFGQPMNDARPLGVGGNEGANMMAANQMAANQGDGAPAQAMGVPGAIGNTNYPTETPQN